MPLVLSDRVKVRSRTTGTGAFLLEDTVQGFRNFTVIGDGNETYYGITDNAGNWEIGRGTYTAAGPSLSRDSILSSSNNDTFVDFPVGAKNVFCTFPAAAANSFQYNLSAESAVEGAVLRLAFSEGSADEVTLVGTNGTTISRPDANTIKIDTSKTQGMIIAFGL